jgi:RNA polymerase sigma factor (sigma-70 family)
MNEKELNLIYDDLMAYKTFFFKQYPTIPTDEIESELNYAIAKAYKVFDPTKNCSFKTFVITIMHNQCKVYIRTTKKRWHMLQGAFRLDEPMPVSETEDTWYDYYSKDAYDRSAEVNMIREVVSYLHEHLSNLKKNQYRILDLYLQGYKTTEISRILKISHQSIWGTKVRVIDKILRPLVAEFPFLREYEVVQSRIKCKEIKVK